MRDLFQARVMTPLIVIIVIQSVLTMASYAIPVIAPVAAIDLGMAPSAVGAAVSIVYFTAMLAGLPSGLFIARFGAQRVFQATLVLAGAGILLIALGHPLWALAGALLIGTATAPMNPTGSHVLARVSPPNWQPLIFSIKQCSTPAGGMLAGAILPPLIVLYDWRMALTVVPALALAALILSMIFGVGPREPRRAGSRIALRDILASLRFVWLDRILRGYALAGMAFAGCQLAMATYLVVYLWRELGIAPEIAGLIFAVNHVSGIVARIILGFVAGRWLATKTILPILALVGAAGLTALALSSASWPLAFLFVTATVVGAGGNGWVGLFLSEIAILAADGRAADATSGAQFFMYGGIVAGPLLGSGIIAVTGSYPALYMTFAVVAFAAGLGLYRLTR
ncbi:MAG: MFS transporter [Alphaproteobacteria bacterium]|nr:MFS transporter [Alphaproteobacteria bacterium]